MPQDSAPVADLTIPLVRAAHRPTADAPPRLLSVATAVPPIVLRQKDVVARVATLFDRRASEIERLLPVFENTGIDTRYSCVPLEWYERNHGWAERNRLYLTSALDLLNSAARSALAQAKLRANEIDAVVTVSTTGIATPSLDAHLLDRLGLRPDVLRLPIFGLGCAGGVLGLARAAALARAMPGARVLLLVVELCALTFRKVDQSKSNIIAAALFGDGAAALVIGPGGADLGGLPMPAIAESAEHTWPQSLDVMGWHVEDDGLGVQFSRDIPTLVRTQYRPVLNTFLARQQYALSDYDGFVCHPGGTKVIAALEDVFDLEPGALQVARRVLHDYGNMSAATVLFVLQAMLRLPRNRMPRRWLMSSLGPGFTAALLTLDQFQ